MEIYMNNMDLLVEELHDAIRESEEYKKYHQLLGEIKLHPDLYALVNQYRRRNFQLQMAETESFLDANEQVQREFATVYSDTLAKDFLLAEVILCKKIREINDSILEVADIDIDFLEA